MSHIENLDHFMAKYLTLANKSKKENRMIFNKDLGLICEIAEGGALAPDETITP